MKVDNVQIGLIAVLFLIFMAVPQITQILGHSLDTMPMRLGAVLLILAVLPYDKFVALGVFLVITAIYIQHHQDAITGVTQLSNIRDLNAAFAVPTATANLDKGGNADETYETNEFVPRSEDQDNEFTSVGHSLDEKQVLVSESLGSKSQSIFNEDMKQAEALAQSNRDGHD